jgi:parallel beta helix pectate lyase-like protein
MNRRTAIKTSAVFLPPAALDTGDKRMIKFLLAFILFLPLVASSAQQPQGACVVAGTDVPAALAEAQAGARCLELPAGIYSVGAPVAGAWLNADADNLEVRGAGEGKTVLQITSPLTLTQDMAVLRLFGVGQRVHDLTIQLSSGHSGAGSLAGISVYGSGALGTYQGRAERATIERVEVIGGYSATGAGGYGIGTYRGYLDQGGAQYVTIRDCFIHDGPATAIGINSNSNLILNNHIARVGLNGFSHGVYAQGGNNLYEGNTIENASGYSFHGHKQVPSLDGSGDRYIGNLSLNPGSGHIVINSTVNGSNPGLPAGAQLTRYATISGNTFRNTLGHRAGGIWCNGVPCVIDGNVLEDTYVTNGGGWIDDSGGSIITSNLLTTISTPDGATNFSMIRVTGIGATVANNRLVMNVGCCAALTVSGNEHTVTGNAIRVGGGIGVASGNALVIGGDGMLVTDNRLITTGSMNMLSFSGAPTNLRLTGNSFKRTASTGPLFNVALTGVTGLIADNFYDGTPQWGGTAPGVLR